MISIIIVVLVVVSIIDVILHERRLSKVFIFRHYLLDMNAKNYRDGIHWKIYTNVSIVEMCKFKHKLTVDYWKEYLKKRDVK